MHHKAKQPSTASILTNSFDGVFNLGSPNTETKWYYMESHPMGLHGECVQVPGEEGQ